MKNLIMFGMLTISTSVFANTLKFNIEDIDSISLKDKTVIVEDLRDGFESLNGVNVSEDYVTIEPSKNLELQFRSGMKLNTRAMAIKKGGDMGGG